MADISSPFEQKPGAHPLLEIGLVLLPIVLGTFVDVLINIQDSWMRDLVGPGSVVVAVVIASFFMRRRGIKWRDFGLSKPRSFWKTFFWTIVAVAGTLILAGAGTAWAIDTFDLQPIDYSRFVELQGNLPKLLFWLAIGWTAAAFGEEMLARGFLLNRIADTMGRGRIALVLAAFAQAALFGLAHFYQGSTGMVATGIAGLVMGIVYLLSKKSLWPVIIAHGLVDTIGLTLFYLGAVEF